MKTETKEKETWKFEPREEKSEENCSQISQQRREQEKREREATREVRKFECELSFTESYPFRSTDKTVVSRRGDSLVISREKR